MVPLIYSSDLRVNVKVYGFNTKKKKMCLTVSESYILIAVGKKELYLADLFSYTL